MTNTKNLKFTVVVPGTAGGLVPYWLSGQYDPIRVGSAAMLMGSCLVVVGLALYAARVWQFATIGEGTPAPIDAPRRLVAMAPTLS